MSFLTRHAGVEMRTLIRTAVALVALVAFVALTGCASSAGPRRSDQTDLRDLSGDASDVRVWFDAHRQHPRAILLLSPV